MLNPAPEDNEVLVQSGPRGGPLTARLSRKGGRAQVLSVRREPESGLWACGNAVLDNAASSANVLVWAAYDGRKSVWRRKEVGIEADPEDLLPWLLRVPAMQGLGLSQMAKGKELPKAKGANGKTEGGFSPPRRRQRNWSSISMDSDIAGVFVASAEDLRQCREDPWVTPRQVTHARLHLRRWCSINLNRPSLDAVVSTTGKVPAYFDTFNAAADAARVSAILDARQVLGAAGNYQDSETSLSTLWQRLPETPRRNVLQRLTAFHDGSFVPGSYVAEFPAGNWSEVFVGRHRFPVVHTDIQALLKRYTLAEDGTHLLCLMVGLVFRATRFHSLPLPARTMLPHGHQPWPECCRCIGPWRTQRYLRDSEAHTNFVLPILPLEQLRRLSTSFLHLLSMQLRRMESTPLAFRTQRKSLDRGDRIQVSLTSGLPQLL
eukprot:g27145.t1